MLAYWIKDLLRSIGDALFTFFLAAYMATFVAWPIAGYLRG